MTSDQIERKQWRGKIRVHRHRNANGDTYYTADYRLSWWISFDWLPVESGPPIRGDGYSHLQTSFAALVSAKLAAQLQWNAAAVSRKASIKTRFGKPVKVWP